MSAEKVLDPVMMLGVARLDGTPIDSPLFAAVSVTEELLTRLRLLTDLCGAHRIDWLMTETLTPPVYWDQAPGDPLGPLTDITTQWHVLGTLHYAELTARRPLPGGGYGLPEVIGQTPLVDIVEYESLQARGYIIDFREHERHDEVIGTPFVLAVYRRMMETKLWPEMLDPQVFEVADDDSGFP